IGMSNVVSGRTLDENHIDFAGVHLRVNDGSLQAGNGAISIRQHQIRLLPKEPAQKDNVVPAQVVRQVFLGSSGDYMVEVAGGTQLRVVTSPGEDVRQGADVWLHMPAEYCRGLVD